MQDVYTHYYDGPSWDKGPCQVMYKGTDGTSKVRFEADPLNTFWAETRHIVPISHVTPHKPSVDMLLPTDPQERKNIPITTGFLDYFPLAVAEVAKCSKAGNDQHHPGEPLFWDKTKSTDHADCIARHLVDRGKFDTDGQRHSAKLAWRSLALLQLELENEKEKS